MPAGIPGQIEPGRTPLDAGQHELLDRVEADRAELHPYLPAAQVKTTAAADYAALLSRSAA